MPLCLPYKGTILQGPARDDYISQGALLPLSGGIAPLPVRDAVETSDRARPGVFRVLPQRRDEAVTGLGRRARQGATGGRDPSCPAPFTLLSVSYPRRRLDGSGPTARGRGGELGPRAVARPRPLGRRQRR